MPKRHCKTRCPACDRKWVDHPGIAITCEQRRAIADKLLVAKVLLGITAVELGLEAGDTVGIVKAIRRLKRQAKKAVRANAQPRGATVWRPHHD